MSSLDLRVLVLERWKRRWDDGSIWSGAGSVTVPVGSVGPLASGRLLGRYSAGSGPAQEISVGTGLLLSGAGVLSTTGVPLGSGATDTVTLWSSATSLTSDSLLHYDRVQHWLSIGTTTPTAPLTFGNDLGPKIDVYHVPGAGRYGMGLQSQQLQIYADPGSQVRLGNMAADGVTFQPRFDVGPTLTFSSVPLGVMWGAVTGYELTTNRLYAVGTSYIAQLGVQVAPEPAWYAIATNGIHCYTPSRFESTLSVGGSVDAYGYCMMNSLRLGDHVAPGAILDVNGAALVRGHLDVLAGGHLIVSGGGYLQVTGALLYTDASTGIATLGTPNTAGSLIFTRGIAMNPSWQYCRLDAQHTPGSHVDLVMSADGGANTLFFRVSGANAYVSVGAWVDAASDRAVKRDIVPIDAPLERLARLHGSHYERTDLKQVAGFPAPQTQEYGLIAQDVAEALPGAAFEHDYGTRGVLWNYYDRPILALLVESVKALAQRVQALEGV